MDKVTLGRGSFLKGFNVTTNMSWIAQHGRHVFIFFTFPLVGLVMDAFLETKKLIYGLVLMGILLAPAITGYSYTFSWGYYFFAFVGLCCTYSLFSKEIEEAKRKIWSAVFASGILFLVLGWFSIIDSFSGSQTVVRNWHTEDYKVEYVRDQGFAGGPLMKYELSKYSRVPFFVKRLNQKLTTTPHIAATLSLSTARLFSINAAEQ
jgi:hypothetical protein